MRSCSIHICPSKAREFVEFFSCRPFSSMIMPVNVADMLDCEEVVAGTKDGRRESVLVFKDESLFPPMEPY